MAALTMVTSPLRGVPSLANQPWLVIGTLLIDQSWSVQDAADYIERMQQANIKGNTAVLDRLRAAASPAHADAFAYRSQYEVVTFYTSDNDPRWLDIERSYLTSDPSLTAADLERLRQTYKSVEAVLASRRSAPLIEAWQFVPTIDPSWSDDYVDRLEEAVGIINAYTDAVHAVHAVHAEALGPSVVELVIDPTWPGAPSAEKVTIFLDASLSVDETERLRQAYAILNASTEAVLNSRRQAAAAAAAAAPAEAKACDICGDRLAGGRSPTVRCQKEGCLSVVHTLCGAQKNERKRYTCRACRKSGLHGCSKCTFAPRGCGSCR